MDTTVRITYNAHFKVFQTQRPDVYKLFVSHKDKIKKYSYAHIPNIKISKFMKSLFPTDEKKIHNEFSLEPIGVMLEFVYAPHFEKWVPLKESSKTEPDRYSTIKKILKSVELEKKTIRTLAQNLGENATNYYLRYP